MLILHRGRTLAKTEAAISLSEMMTMFRLIIYDAIIVVFHVTLEMVVTQLSATQHPAFATLRRGDQFMWNQRLYAIKSRRLILDRNELRIFVES
jgi:hypothetical protein